MIHHTWNSTWFSGDAASCSLSASYLQHSLHTACVASSSPLPTLLWLVTFWKTDGLLSVCTTFTLTLLSKPPLSDHWHKTNTGRTLTQSHLQLTLLTPQHALHWCKSAALSSSFSANPATTTTSSVSLLSNIQPKTYFTVVLMIKKLSHVKCREWMHTELFFFSWLGMSTNFCVVLTLFRKAEQS